MKLVLSRKGFDSSAGGVASPIFPDGSMVSLPIPWPGGGITYDKLFFKGDPLSKIVGDLTNNQFVGNREAHLDPHLSRSIYDTRDENWRQLFGQVDAAQGHLENEGVKHGDLFLFFGWFRRVEKNISGNYQYVIDAPDLHVLFGWLQIAEILPIKDLDKQKYSWTSYHPHCKEPGSKKKKRNTLYVASERLSLLDCKIGLPGAGCFERYRDELLLTAPISINEKSFRSVWKLPKWFYSEEKKKRLSYHREDHRWPALFADYVILNSVGRGQEFVVDIDGDHFQEAMSWLRNIFSS